MKPFKSIFTQYQYIVVYGLLMAVLVFALKWLQWRFLIVDNSIDIYVGLIAVFFTLLGIGVSLQLSKPKVHTVVIEKEVPVPQQGSFSVNTIELEKLNLTSREYEVLRLMAKGHSNTEIAKELFLSLSTVKTHASNLFVKMDVTSRTKAIEKAKRLKITP
ncbi:response regulator transcription factor [Parachryseolinea silvisoli]|uniref:response regulator transcription factor n=1 Tax=Parachryseolinea silvisoli TaxID=2873601 RepID=UPI00295E331E|nr:response regulator transcription factor [Parachryseolinea silvisoli]MCD9016429.1 response regulator transcription factor [Parachryseolinea silvisoli]